MNKHVLLVEEKGKVHGRLLDGDGNTGFIVFTHFSIESKKGLLKISDTIIKEGKNKKYGFVKGDYINPEKIDVKTLSHEQLSQLAAVGFIKSHVRINDIDFIVIKDHNVVLNNIYYLAFLSNGKFEFIRYLKYMKSHTKFVSDLSYIEKQLHRMFLTTPMRSGTFRISKKDMALEENSLIYKNLDKVVWRRIATDVVTDSDYCICMYNCDCDSDYDKELHSEIIKYNEETANEVSTNVKSIIGTSDEKEVLKVYKRLAFYGLS